MNTEESLPQQNERLKAENRALRSRIMDLEKLLGANTIADSPEILRLAKEKEAQGLPPDTALRCARNQVLNDKAKSL